VQLILLTGRRLLVMDESFCIRLEFYYISQKRGYEGQCSLEDVLHVSSLLSTTAAAAAAAAVLSHIIPGSEQFDATFICVTPRR